MTDAVKDFSFRANLTNTFAPIRLFMIGSVLNHSAEKRFKCESELDAYLFNHHTTKLKCDQCTYENPDLRNMCAHKRKHSDKKVFSVKNVDKGSDGSNNAGIT